MKDLITSKERIESINNFSTNYIIKTIKKGSHIYLFVLLISILLILSISKNFGA